jgi:hypothetical protein
VDINIAHFLNRAIISESHFLVGQMDSLSLLLTSLPFSARLFLMLCLLFGLNIDVLLEFDACI